MAMYTIGEIIKAERLKQGVTQELLSDGICSTSWLSKIESGIKEPAAHMTEQILQRLGLSMGQYIDISEDFELTILEIKLEIEEKFFFNDFEALKTLLVQFKMTMNTEKLLHEQFYLTYHTLAYGDDLGDVEQLKRLEKAIRMTHPSFKVATMQKSMYTMIEIITLNKIAVLYAKAERILEAEKIWKTLVGLMESSKFDSDSKRKLYPDFCKNLAKVSIHLGQYSEALTELEKAIEFMLIHNMIVELPGLLYNKGIALGYLGSMAEAQIYLTQSYYMDLAIGNEDKAKRHKTEIMGLFGLVIDDSK